MTAMLTISRLGHVTTDLKYLPKEAGSRPICHLHTTTQTAVCAGQKVVSVQWKGPAWFPADQCHFLPI